MKAAGNKNVGAFFSAVRVGVPVIVVHAKPKDKAKAAAVLVGKLFVLQKALDCVLALLYGNYRSAVVTYLPRRQKAVARRAQGGGILVKRPGPVLDFSSKKLVESFYSVSLVFRKIDIVFFDKRLYQKIGKRRIQKTAARFGESGSAKRL